MDSKKNCLYSNSCNISKNILPVSEELLVNCYKSSKSVAFMTICNNATFSIEALTSSKTSVEHWFRMNCSVLSLIVTTEDRLLCALVQVNTYLLICMLLICITSPSAIMQARSELRCFLSITRYNSCLVPYSTKSKVLTGKFRDSSLPYNH